VGGQTRGGGIFTAGASSPTHPVMASCFARMGRTSSARRAHARKHDRARMEAAHVGFRRGLRSKARQCKPLTAEGPRVWCTHVRVLALLLHRGGLRRHEAGVRAQIPRPLRKAASSAAMSLSRLCTADRSRGAPGRQRRQTRHPRGGCGCRGSLLRSRRNGGDGRRLPELYVHEGSVVDASRRSAGHRATGARRQRRGRKRDRRRREGPGAGGRRTAALTVSTT